MPVHFSRIHWLLSFSFELYCVKKKIVTCIKSVIRYRRTHHSLLPDLLCQQLMADQNAMCVIIWRKWYVRVSGRSCPPDRASTRWASAVHPKNDWKNAIYASYKNCKRLQFLQGKMSHMTYHTSEISLFIHTILDRFFIIPDWHTMFDSKLILTCHLNTTVWPFLASANPCVEHKRGSWHNFHICVPLKVVLLERCKVHSW